MGNVIVVGGGAAGMIAAYAAAGHGHSVVLFEKNEKLGKKLFITGKGRCNVTNACEKDKLFENIVSNPKFLYSAFGCFDNRQMMDLLEKAAVEKVPPVVQSSSFMSPQAERCITMERMLRKSKAAILRNSAGMYR